MVMLAPLGKPWAVDVTVAVLGVYLQVVSDPPTLTEVATVKVVAVVDVIVPTVPFNPVNVDVVQDENVTFWPITGNGLGAMAGVACTRLESIAAQPLGLAAGQTDKFGVPPPPALV